MSLNLQSTKLYAQIVPNLYRNKDFYAINGNLIEDSLHMCRGSESN